MCRGGFQGRAGRRGRRVHGVFRRRAACRVFSAMGRGEGGRGIVLLVDGGAGLMAGGLGEGICRVAGAIGGLRE